jgi:hypothetical protein
MILSSFVLIGTIIASDDFLATVEFNLNPATNGGPAIGVLPVQSIPCKVTIGQKIYVVKDKNQDIPTISCKKND